MGAYLRRTGRCWCTSSTGPGTCRALWGFASARSRRPLPAAPVTSPWRRWRGRTDRRRCTWGWRRAATTRHLWCTIRAETRDGEKPVITLTNAAVIESSDTLEVHRRATSGTFILARLVMTVLTQARYRETVGGQHYYDFFGFSSINCEVCKWTFTLQTGSVSTDRRPGSLLPLSSVKRTAVVVFYGETPESSRRLDEGMWAILLRLSFHSEPMLKILHVFAWDGNEVSKHQAVVVITNCGASSPAAQKRETFTPATFIPLNWARQWLRQHFHIYFFVFYARVASL